MPEDYIFHLSCKRGKNDHFVVKKEQLLSKEALNAIKCKLARLCSVKLRSFTFESQMKGASPSTFPLFFKILLNLKGL